VKPVDEQLALIRRGVVQIEREDELKRKLQTGKPLRVKFGIDPTSVDVHLGHTVPLRKLRQFQQLGHQAVLIIGNYTALVGDPSGRDQTRARLTQEQVEINAKDYLRQVSRIIDIEKTEVTHNGDWFGKFSFLDVMQLTSKITMQQMLAREEFSNRIAKKTEIRLHECLYPLMQGYDSVATRADIEVGGTDQLFNFMVARSPAGRGAGTADLHHAADYPRHRWRPPHGQELGQLHRRRRIGLRAVRQDHEYS